MYCIRYVQKRERLLCFNDSNRKTWLQLYHKYIWLIQLIIFVTIVKYECAFLFLDNSIGSGSPVFFTDKYTIQDIQCLNSKSFHFLI